MRMPASEKMTIWKLKKEYYLHTEQIKKYILYSTNRVELKRIARIR